MEGSATIADENMCRRRPLENTDEAVELSWIYGGDELFIYPLYYFHPVCCKARAEALSLSQYACMLSFSFFFFFFKQQDFRDRAVRPSV